jgi:mono/diheme cytochrome c family protein
LTRAKPPRKQGAFIFDSDGAFYENYTVIYTAFMTNRRKHSIWLRSCSGALLAAAIIAVAFSGGAQEQEQKPLDAADIAEGMRLFQQKGNCQSCHGWAGDGRKTDSQMPDGANLPPPARSNPNPPNGTRSFPKSMPSA